MNTLPLILVIEDSPTQAKQIAATLASYNLRVIIASDGLEGLQVVDSQRPEVIILDVNLPTMNGYQVCSRLKRDTNTAHIPVIMLTSIGGADATLQGLEVGADDYIAKDEFTTENLLATLDSYLNILKGRG
jgi:DNA-binding response OmpR family regulator